MEVREILQTEIWSAETSRRIIRVARRVLGFIGIAVACALIWYVVNHLWLTRLERREARSALVQIDALQQNLTELSDTDYVAHYKQAEGNVHAAEEAAWTAKDRSVAGLLSNYLMFTDVRRSQQKFLLKLSNSKDERSQKYAASEAQSGASSITASSFESEVLHQLLR